MVTSCGLGLGLVGFDVVVAFDCIVLVIATMVSCYFGGYCVMLMTLPGLMIFVGWYSIVFRVCVVLCYSVACYVDGVFIVFVFVLLGSGWGGLRWVVCSCGWFALGLSCSGFGW